MVPVGGGSKFKIIEGLIQNKSTLLILTVVLTSIFLINDNTNSKLFNSKLLIYFGERSYSIFIWHQVILAFYRYFVSNQITVWFVVAFFAVAVGVSELSYRFIEQKVKISHKSFIGWVIAAVFVSIPAGWVYLHAGVVRNVPELNITVDNVHRGMHGEYCDRVYTFDKDFPPANDKPNVLVEGTSFGRDFANCLLESSYRDSVNLSYIFIWEEKYVERLRQADYVFTFRAKTEVPSYVWNNLKENAEVWGVGTKNYGESNGIVYSQRFKDDYLDYSVPLNANYKMLNDQWAKEWGDRYINFIKMSTLNNGQIRVFTPEGKFISQDCEHLTKEGAQWYAEEIDWNKIF